MGSEQPSPRGGLQIEAGIWGSGDMTQDGQKAQWLLARTQASRPWGQHHLPQGVQTQAPPGSPVHPGTVPSGHTLSPCAGVRGWSLSYSGQA